MKLTWKLGAAVVAVAVLSTAAIAQQRAFFGIATGGTGGVSYLRKMLDVVLFPEIWSLRTQL